MVQSWSNLSWDQVGTKFRAAPKQEPPQWSEAPSKHKAKSWSQLSPNCGGTKLGLIWDQVGTNLGPSWDHDPVAQEAPPRSQRSQLGAILVQSWFHLSWDQVGTKLRAAPKQEPPPWSWAPSKHRARSWSQLSCNCGGTKLGPNWDQVGINVKPSWDRGPVAEGAHRCSKLVSTWCQFCANLVPT